MNSVGHGESRTVRERKCNKCGIKRPLKTCFYKTDTSRYAHTCKVCLNAPKKKKNINRTVVPKSKRNVAALLEVPWCNPVVILGAARL